MSDGLLRAAIAVERRMEPPAVANAAAVLMGQLSRLEPRLYADPVADLDGVPHAGIRFNVVILTGRLAQVVKVAAAAREAGLPHTAFSTAGRALSNSFAEYRELVGRSGSAELDICAVGVAGPDEQVRELTRALSSYKGT
jgi:hypothetical protein